MQMFLIRTRPTKHTKNQHETNSPNFLRYQYPFPLHDEWLQDVSHCASQQQDPPRANTHEAGRPLDTMHKANLEWATVGHSPPGEQPRGQVNCRTRNLEWVTVEFTSPVINCEGTSAAVKSLGVGGGYGSKGKGIPSHEPVNTAGSTVNEAQDIPSQPPIEVPTG